MNINFNIILTHRFFIFLIQTLEHDMKRARQHLNPFGQMMTPGAFDGSFLFNFLKIIMYP